MSESDYTGQESDSGFVGGNRKQHVSELLKALPLSIVAVVGIYFTASEYILRQPSVAVDFVTGEFRDDPIDLENVIDRLDEIEATHYAITGSHIADLKEIAQQIDSGRHDLIALFRDSIREKLGGFSRQHLIDLLEDLEDRISENNIDVGQVVAELQRIEDLHYDHTGGRIIDLIEQARGIESLENQAFRDSLDDAISAFRSQAEGYGPLLADLDDLAEVVDKHIENAEQRLYVVVNIENRSRVPTIIRRDAMIRIWNDGQSYKDINLRSTINEDTIIQEIWVERVEYVSKILRELDSEVRSFLKDEITSRSNCLILLVDMHGNVWHTDSRCTPVRGGVTEKTESEVERLFRRIVNR